jgi:ankyrin repeat protein
VLQQFLTPALRRLTRSNGTGAQHTAQHASHHRRSCRAPAHSFDDVVRVLSAIRSNNPPQVRTLIHAGADPNTTDSNGASALMYGALYADPRVVSYLLSAGAKANHADNDGSPPTLGGLSFRDHAPPPECWSER